MKKHLRIAVDYDDTIAAQNDVLLMLMNWKFDKNWKAEDLDWDYFHRNKHTEKAFWALLDLYDRSYLRRAMAPTDPYVFAVIKELQKAGHLVEIVTRNRPQSKPQIEAWMWQHGVNIRVRAIGRSGGAAGGKARLPYDWFIDDAPSLATGITRYPKKRLLVYNRPWNQKIRLPRNAWRVRSWLDVRDIFMRMGTL